VKVLKQIKDLSMLNEATAEFELAKGNAHAAFRAPLSVAPWVVGAVDFVAFTLAALYLTQPDQQAVAVGGKGIVVCISSAVLLLNLFSFAKLYRIEVIADFAHFCKRFTGLAFFPSIAAALYAVYASLHGHGEWPRLLGLYGAVWIFYVFVARYTWAKVFSFAVRNGYVSHDVVMLGTPDLTSALARRFRRQEFGVRVMASFFYASSGDGDDQSACDIGVSHLMRFAMSHPVNTVLVAVPGLHGAALEALIRQLKVQPFRIRLVPCPLEEQSPPWWCAPAGEVPGLPLLVVAEPPIHGLSCAAKACFDFFVAGLALLVAAPVMLACAVGVKLSTPGPVLFKQTRIGYRNAEFTIYKFRTMHTALCDTGQLTLRNDPRTFWFGSLLRKSSLDELPQLLNVLKGEMSIVGPRPHMPEARAAGQLYHQAVADYPARHRVKPGITGLAQVSGWRGPTETIEQIKRRVEHDLQYIEAWSLILDAKIILKTMVVGFFGKNAF
jgi:Undecaprenyl-phosphate glucose phosphotransferase